MVLVLATQSKVEAEESTGGADGLRIELFLLQLLSVVSVPLWQEPGLSTRSAAASLPVLRLQSEPACEENIFRKLTLVSLRTVSIGT